jgi:hypothetical protein
MAKMKVPVMGENPHCVWYSAYSGVGALEAARNDTVIEASR